MGYDKRQAALICDVADQPDGWLDLRPQKIVSKTGIPVVRKWILTLGWPFVVSPSETLPEFGIILPDTVVITEWASGVFLRMNAGAEFELNDLANFISTLLIRLYHLEGESAVELALEEE